MRWSYDLRAGQIYGYRNGVLTTRLSYEACGGFRGALKARRVLEGYAPRRLDEEVKDMRGRIGEVLGIDFKDPGTP